MFLARYPLNVLAYQWIHPWPSPYFTLRLVALTLKFFSPQTLSFLPLPSKVVWVLYLKFLLFWAQERGWAESQSSQLHIYKPSPGVQILQHISIEKAMVLLQALTGRSHGQEATVKATSPCRSTSRWTVTGASLPFLSCSGQCPHSVLHLNPMDGGASDSH